MQERAQINIWIKKNKVDQLKVLAKELDLPVSTLVRDGVNMVIQKYKNVETKAGVQL